MSSQPQQSVPKTALDTPTPTGTPDDATLRRDGGEHRQAPGRAAGPSVAPRRPWAGVGLVDVAVELGSELGEKERAEARRVVLPTLALDCGLWDPAALSDVAGVRGAPRGVLVLCGALMSEVSIAGRPCARLVGPGELVLLDGDRVDSIPAAFSWSALVPARLAVFDDRLPVIARRWPALLTAICHRAAHTTRNGFLQQAISQLPRVEDRLLALLWTLADRQGVVRADGIWLKLPATHETLARMIGARRPTVSLALRALTEQGCVRAEQGGWLIDRSSLDQLTSTTAPDHQLAGQI